MQIHYPTELTKSFEHYLQNLWCFAFPPEDICSIVWFCLLFRSSQWWKWAEPSSNPVPSTRAGSFDNNERFIRYRRLHCRTSTILTPSECAYILRYVELNHRQENNPWSVRQSLIYHQHREENNVSTWLFISASQTVRTQVNQFLKTTSQGGGQDPFAVHLLILNVMLATWRRYLVYIAGEVRQQVCGCEFLQASSNTL